MRERAPTRLRGLDGALAAVAVAVAAHFPNLPAWTLLLLTAAIAWRWTADRLGLALPPRWLRATAAVAALVLVLAAYRTVNGIEAGTAFLVLMAAVKLLETRTPRDLAVLVFIALFLLYAALLRDQRLQLLPWLLAGTLLATGALLRVYAGSAGDSRREVLRRATALVLQALPLALALFLLFPRLPGPFWGLWRPELGAHRIDGRNDARRRLGPERVRRARVPRALHRSATPAGAALLARAGAARVRREALAASARPGVPGAGGDLLRHALRLPDHARAA